MVRISWIFEQIPVIATVGGTICAERTAIVKAVVSLVGCTRPTFDV